MASIFFLFSVHSVLRQTIRNEVRINYRINAFDLSDELFVANFRLSKVATTDLIAKLSPFLNVGGLAPDLKVCDHNLRIINVNARYPGSVHDSFIYRASALHSHLREYHANNSSSGWLLGDSGYPLEPWLMVPYSDPDSRTPESNFNYVHARARNYIERCNVLLKARFRCLLKHRVLHYAPTRAAKIINACTVMHNWCLKYGIPEPSGFVPEEDMQQDNLISTASQTAVHRAAVNTRNSIAQSL